MRLYSIWPSSRANCPLSSLWNGQKEHQATLERLVDMLTSPPMLAYPDFNLPFILHTDASEEGLGAVLYQQQEKS